MLDRIKATITIILWILLFIVSYLALDYRNQAIDVKARLSLQEQEGRIDEPYKEAMAEKERQIKDYKNKLQARQARVDELTAILKKFNKRLGIINASYGKIVKSKPSKSVIKGEYDKADIESVCAYFINRGIPCEVISK